MAKILEKILVVPLRKARRGTRARFAKKAVNYLKEFVKRHLKARDREVIIGEELNKKIWERGIKNPPRRVQVRAAVVNDRVVVELAEIPEEKWKKFLERYSKEEEKKVKPGKKEESKAEEKEAKKTEKEKVREKKPGKGAGKKTKGKGKTAKKEKEKGAEE